MRAFVATTILAVAASAVGCDSATAPPAPRRGVNPGAFGVARGQHRRGHPGEPQLVEIAVDGLGQRVPEPRHRRHVDHARPQMGNRAQEIRAQRLGLDGVGLGIVHPPQHLHLFGLHFQALAGALGQHQ